MPHLYLAKSFLQADVKAKLLGFPDNVNRAPMTTTVANCMRDLAAAFSEILLVE